jgi:N-methylhydantoinase A
VHSHLVSLDRFDAGLVNAIFERLRREAEAIVSLAANYGEVSERRFADMRYRGQGHELSIEIPARDYGDGDGAALAELFEAHYRKTYNRVIPGLSVEALTFMLVLARKPRTDVIERAPPRAAAPAAPRSKQVFDPAIGAFVEARVLARDAMPDGVLSGPALIVEDQTTTFAPTGFDAHVSPQGHLVLTRRNGA